MTVSEPMHETVEQAIDEAQEAFEETDGGFPCGFAKIVGVDGRSNLAQFIDGTTLPVSLHTTGRTRIHLDNVGGPGLYPKVEAYKAFLDTLQEEYEEAEDWRVDSRWD